MLVRGVYADICRYVSICRGIRGNWGTWICLACNFLCNPEFSGRTGDPPTSLSGEPEFLWTVAAAILLDIGTMITAEIPVQLLEASRIEGTLLSLPQATTKYNLLPRVNSAEDTCIDGQLYPSRQKSKLTDHTSPAKGLW